MVAPAGRPPEPRKPVSVAGGLPIALGRFVKLAGLASTGGEAKHLVAGAAVRVNGELETRRGRKLRAGDIVEVRGVVLEVVGRLDDGAACSQE